MTTDPRRPQDVGRPHRRRATRRRPDTLLDRYQDAMRAELGDVLDEIRPTGSTPGLLGDVPAPRPAIASRMRLWDLAIKLGRELGAALEGADPEGDETAAPARRARRGRIDYG